MNNVFYRTLLVDASAFYKNNLIYQYLPALHFTELRKATFCAKIVNLATRINNQLHKKVKSFFFWESMGLAKVIEVIICYKGNQQQ